MNLGSRGYFKTNSQSAKPKLYMHNMLQITMAYSYMKYQQTTKEVVILGRVHRDVTGGSVR